MPAPEQESPPVKISYGGASYAGLIGALVTIVPLIVDLFSDKSGLPVAIRLALIISFTLFGLTFMVIRAWQSVAAEKARSALKAVRLQTGAES